MKPWLTIMLLLATHAEGLAADPSERVASWRGGELNRASRVSPVLFGFFSTTLPFAEPKLAPGDYLVAYREKGKVLFDKDEGADEAEDEGGAEGEEAAEEPPAEIDDDTPLELLTPEQRLLRQIDLKEHLIIFIDAATGEYVASIKATKAIDLDEAVSA